MADTPDYGGEGYRQLKASGAIKDFGAMYYPPQGTPMNPGDHPAADVPTASEHHWGTTINREAKSDMSSKTADRYGDD